MSGPDMKTIISNATIAALDGDQPYGLIHGGAIAIAEGKIQWIGSAAAVPDEYAGWAPHDAGMLKSGYRADLADWNVGHPADLAYRIGFNPLHARWFAGEPRPWN